MRNTLIFYLYLLKTSIRSSISKRGAFLIEAGLMIANNFIFLAIWWIFFRQFNDVGGWNFKDMMILMAVGNNAYGIMQVCFGGIRNLSKMILSGDLDSFMTQPKNLLFHVMGSKSFSKGWGNILTGFILIIVGHLATLKTLPLLILGMVCGSLVFTSINIIAHSLPFWMGSVEGLSKKYCDALYLFALYPTNIYSGYLQVVMFTFIPAGIIGFLPVELIRSFSWIQLFVLIGTSIGFFAFAYFIFYLGLKRYESGNKFGIRL